MKQSRVLILICFSISFLLIHSKESFADLIFSDEYKLTYLKIPAVDISFSLLDTVEFENKKALRFVGKAKTTGFFHFVFKLTNSYETLIELESKKTLKFTKDCNQTNITQTLTTIYDRENNKANYCFSFGKNYSQEVPPETIDFLTMIFRLLEAEVAEGDSVNFTLDVEGILWKVTAFAKALEVVETQKGSFEATPFYFNFGQVIKGEVREHKTDVVSNRVASMNAGLAVWVSKEKPKRIVKVIYDLSPFDVNINLK